MVQIYPLILFIVELSVYLYISSSTLYRFYRLRFYPDLYMGIGFFLALISSSLRFASSLTTSSELATAYFQIINGLLLMPSIFFWYIGFTLYYENEFSFSVVFVGYLVGLLGGGFMFSDEVYVTYDSVTQNWNGVYPSTFFVLIIPIILFAFVRIIQPMLRRRNYIHNERDRRTLNIMALGVSLVLLWGLTSAITGIEVIRLSRPIFLSLGWLIWYFASRRNPFFLSVSNVIPKRIMITNNEGHLFYEYQFEVDTSQTKSELIAPLLQAINNMAREVLSSGTGVKSYQVAERNVVSISINNFYYHLISDGLDNTIVGLFNYFSEHTIEKVKSAGSSEYINLNTEVQNYFNQLILIEPKGEQIEIEVE